MEIVMKENNICFLKWSVLVLILLSFFPGQGFSQDKAVNLQRIDITRLPEISLFFTVTNENGDSIPGLTENELEITVDGEKQQISSLTSAFEGGVYLAVALLFDRSGSMKNAIDKSKDAGVAFLKRMSGEDRIAVISFDHEVEVNSTFTKDRAASEQAINKIVLGGNTALYDAIHEALGLLKNEATPRQAIVVLSDGKDTKSRIQRDEMLAGLKNKNVPIFAINLDSQGDENNLKDLAQQTGGNYFEAATSNELLYVYQVIADQLNNQYVLVFQSTPKQDEKFHGLEVTFKDPAGQIVSVQREYIATKGPGVRLETVSGLKRQVEMQSVILIVGIGTIFGLLLGLVILLLLKLVRPEIRVFSLLSLALILSTVILGGIIGVIYYYLL
jgi:VWFA-related protein